jgi:hypothetical protein
MEKKRVQTKAEIAQTKSLKRKAAELKGNEEDTQQD